MARRGVTAAPALAAAVLAPVNAYQLTLLAAAARGLLKPPPAVGAAGGVRFTVLVPARDEEAAIGRTLASLDRLEYPRNAVEVIVIADNCSDRTADVAAEAGATVWERRGGKGGGKGAALDWGLDRAVHIRREADAIVLVDADCEVAPNLLAAIEARLRAGAVAVQVATHVGNPDSSWVAGLRSASLSLVGYVRPLGKATLGLSAGLSGSGMAFRRALVARHPWTARSLLEDQEHHLELVAAGERVAFARETWVRQQMPTSLAGSRSQQLRWDAGRSKLIRKWTPRLLAAGLRRRDAAQLHAAIEVAAPPQSLLLAANLAAALMALTSPPRVRRAALANLAGQAGFVTGGLALAGAPAAVWRSLALAPALAAWKLGLLMRLWLGRGPTTWVRTEREPVPQTAFVRPPAPDPPNARRAIRRS